MQKAYRTGERGLQRYRYAQHQSRRWNSVSIGSATWIIIGISGHHPVTDGVNRDKEHMLSRWNEVVGSLEKAHKHFNKPIMFAEIGVRNEEGCTQYPWDFHDRLDKPLDEQEQADFYDTAMEATWDLDWFCGYFWWDWKAILPPIEEAKKNRDFTVYGKLGEEVLKKWYTKD